jgi:predicted metal-dependent hydrolase
MNSNSNRFLIIIIGGILLLSAMTYYEGFTNDIEYIESSIDQRSYRVRNLPDKESAAKLLSLIRARLIKLVNYMRKKYPNDQRVIRLVRNFNPDQISESLPNSKYTSYSVNKGEKIVFCVRQRNEQNELVDMNTMMFVSIHELAHLMTVSIGHTKEFWSNMKFILKDALDAEVPFYKYQPFHEDPKPYCGTMITDTPLKLESTGLSSVKV